MKLPGCTRGRVLGSGVPTQNRLSTLGQILFRELRTQNHVFPQALKGVFRNLLGFGVEQVLQRALQTALAALARIGEAKRLQTAFRRPVRR